jgi:hypothetical protein
MGWVTITSLEFTFNSLDLNTVVLILSASGVNIKISNASALIL